MSGDCKGTIDQEAGELKITFEPRTCDTCPETDCDGKMAAEIPDPPNDSEPNPVPDLEKVLAEKLAAKEKTLNAFNEKTVKALQHIMTGGAHSFIILTVDDTAVQENVYMSDAGRKKVYAVIATAELEKSFKALTTAPGWMNRLLADILK